MIETLALALALVMVIEGLLPFAMPAFWKRNMLRIAGLPDRHIRVFGLVSLLGGMLLALLAR
ncbi:DUF2065 domain-containing protein [Jeongeupia chitinilytica]|uniref:DUF2065 domain-containing protein n=1 Tax=Jeongeupia chitinilytica TaxID=1041641 RepID=A0ABQ3H2D2_9NEIS|nr:DUF2065 domain-containing protein [Jeongeupia chitinilytica]GHD62943.1 hypothetical protein GCM10007350_19410 [Jeongeupia chitinilytica]